MKLKTLATLVVLVTWLAQAHGVMAASISAQGISLTPAIEQLSLNPNQPSTSYQIRVDNNTAAPLDISISSLDFKSLNETGGLAFIGTSSGNVNNRYGLAKWISFEPQISLPPGASQKVTINVNNRADLSAGGHYASILFKVNNQGGSGSNHVQINEVASSLLFLSKLGGDTHIVKLSNVSFNSDWFSWPTVASLHFTNSGNTQVAPHGIFNFRDSKYIFNQDSNLTLPGSTRRYGLNLTGLKKPFWPGKYHYGVTYHADSLNPHLGYQSSVIYINPWFLLIIPVLIAWLLITRPKLRHAWTRRVKRAFRFGKRLTKVIWLFFSVYLPYKYRQHQNLKRAKVSKKPPAVKLQNKPPK